MIPSKLHEMVNIGEEEAIEALKPKEMNPPRSPSKKVRKLPEMRKQLARRMNFDEIPIKAQRLFKEISECFDEEAIFVTCIGLNQVWCGQFQKIQQHATT
jgi:tartronate-semialdehyde synthase